MKLRVIENAAGRFAIQHAGGGILGKYWLEPGPGDIFLTAEEAIYEMERRLKNCQHAKQNRQVKRVIAEGET